ncbi:MAG: leucyl/phenylalanyl-tRNA--protein transferase [Bacteroidetes bacterium HGW-Bacteroidetes-23]|uniref:Leucyl/phenylalanyl-tRNA--protein transferase n=1 Tax=Flavobacterium azooxidireducens TaxID=1871076 RepID=A0ABY4KH71_9FLAO|nr:leucyl/phenylalanyl-tRNA--protein transferase [Flavobacterium azooxidireducens]PKP14956.1 MAG: leucyl/phenylalanyl-tRNA--protein transferase [Bacteroidetes bacterium HGW-Bacteroidetes-23]UPQ80161.1 leucyl/phenylalanyl-tRNA--protein transferase [Flavobacterium azooxidireducens]
MYFLSKDLYFPPVSEASYEGILAVGGDLSTERLLLAYQNGIFPWFEEDEPILWWSPPQRMVVNPKEYKIAKSLRNILNRKIFEVTFNQNFSEVIEHCQTIKRKGQQGTWITDSMFESYLKLHELGIAKSVEVWQNNELVGGLYGVDLGNVFCGESMFSKVPNASKVAFVSLIEKLKQENYLLLDCQVHNDHLEKLGAFEISRDTYLKILKSKR